MSPMCDVCGIRPAVGTIRRIRPRQPAETLHLCEIHMAEQRGMRSGFGGLGMFDDFFSRFFSEGRRRRGCGWATGPGTSRAVEQMDVTELFSDATRELATANRARNVILVIDPTACVGTRLSPSRGGCALCASEVCHMHRDKAAVATFVPPARRSGDR